MKKHAFPIAAGAVVLFMLACRLSPCLDRAALDGFCRPAMLALQRLTAPVPFPVAEPLGLVLAALPAFRLFASLGSAKALCRWLTGVTWAALTLGGLLALLWGPALLLAEEAVSPPEGDRLAWLCGALVDALNGMEPAFPDPVDTLRLAPDVAGLSDAVVKAARYPEWMEAAGIWGLYVPLTGEALVDVTAPAPLIPFTAVHELMHLAGIADEGAANIAAWQRCMDAGGAFADSARLWALRYAMGLLCHEDASAWRRAEAGMEDHLRQIYRACGGEALPAGRGLACVPGNYAALAGYLAQEHAPDDPFIAQPASSAAREKPDAVVVAGDIHDKAVLPTEAVSDRLRALSRAPDMADQIQESAASIDLDIMFIDDRLLVTKNESGSQTRWLP